MRNLKITGLLCATTFAFGMNGKAENAEIANAMTAAPPEVSAATTIVNADQKVLREGSNGYTCWTSVPFLGDRPMCIDAGWTQFMNAMLDGKDPPQRETVAIGYWLQGVPAMSNSDPAATLEQAKPQGQEIISGDPHIAILVPDNTALSTLPTTPDAGRPWAMWGDTPYAHIMVPAPSPN